MKRRLIWIGLAAAMFAATGPAVPGSPDPAYAATNRLVRGSDLPSLMIGPKDLPLDVTLWSLESGPKGNVTLRDLGRGARGMSVSWAGPPSAPSIRHTYYVDITAAVFDSPAKAGQAAAKFIGSFAVVTPEVRDMRTVPFADHAWVSGGVAAVATFCRKNVMARVIASGPELDDPKLALRVAALIGRKIDAAAAGKPEPAPKLPPSSDSTQVWTPGYVDKHLMFPARNTIFLKHDDRPVTPTVVDRVTGNNCMVRLVPLMFAVSKKRSIKIRGDEANAAFCGKNFVFKDGSAVVRVDGKSVRLSRPVRFSGSKGDILRSVRLPLSFVEKALGWRIRWQNGKKIRTARI